MFHAVPFLLAFTLATNAQPEKQLLTNGDFERGLSGWSKFWSRSDGGTAELTTDRPQQGKGAIRIHYVGREDWSFPQAESIVVKPGEIYELTGWVRMMGDGQASLSVILYDAERQSLDWDFGGHPVPHGEAWQQVRTRFMIPPQGATILPRIMGYGPSDVWLDDVVLLKVGSVEQLQVRNLPQSISIESAHLRLTFVPSTASIQVTDRRSGQVYSQPSTATLVVLRAHARDRDIVFELLKPDDMLTVRGTVQLDEDRPEFVVELSAEGEMRQPLSFPLPFLSQAGQFLILPVNEGISYRVDDDTLSPMNYHLYGGHGLCMSFWGNTNLQSSLMAIVETPDDARVDIPRVDGLLCLAPQWEPQKGVFGPSRRIRYVAQTDGGYVAVAKRYRQYAQQAGRWKSLAQKRDENPHVDRLIGAVNVWCWDQPGPTLCEEMQQAGIDRILWSSHSSPEQIKRMNEMGVLTSRYDIYQDVMDPANFDEIGYQHPDWTTQAWPRDLVLEPDGSWTKGWVVEGKNGQRFPCGVLCDRLAVNYARQRIPQELASHPYRCRFIDTTTASPWRECYSPDHPMTRSESRQYRMELLDYVSGTMGLVTGSETGHDAAVPYVHYFEGMLSLGPYRVDDAGRDMLRVVEQVPPQIATFQTGHYYRLPLWELVYHDCVVAQWYWGDYNNKLPAVWDRRDLFNALYGTPPMFMFNRKIWDQNRDRFVQSYQAAAAVARATGYSEMLDHRWLSADHSVQQTTFADGTKVTVNFGDQPFLQSDGRTLAPLSQSVER